MTHEVEIRRLEAQQMASIRMTVAPAELSAALEEVLPEVWGALEGAGVQPAGPPFARYYDANDQVVDFDAGLPVAAPVSPMGRVQPGVLPGGECAATWHVGPYETLRQAYVALEGYMRDNNREPAEAPWEVYWTDSGEEPDPARWRTEVIWPIR